MPCGHKRSLGCVWDFGPFIAFYGNTVQVVAIGITVFRELEVGKCQWHLVMHIEVFSTQIFQTKHKLLIGVFTIT
jgi:hypothetical protein